MITKNGKDPKAIVKYVSVRYMKQALSGCGAEACANPFCRSHRGEIEERIPMCLLSITMHHDDSKQLMKDVLLLTRTSIDNGVFCICTSMLT